MDRLSELQRDLLSPKVLRALFVGALVAAIVVIYSIALASIVFSGPLQPYASRGAGMMMLGAMIFCALMGAASGHSGMLAFPQEGPAAVLAAFAAAAGALAVPGETAFVTMAVLLLLSGAVTGLFLYAVGHYRLAGLFRFVPYPVAGGFLAGTGWVLAVASLSLMTGETLDLQAALRLLDPSMAWRWVPGTVYGLVLTVVMNRGGNIVTMLGSVVLFSGFYHLGLSFLDIPIEDARSRGLFMSGILQEGAFRPGFGTDVLTGVDWSLVAGRAPDLLAVAFVTMLCLLVNVNSLETATGSVIDLNREFRLAGIANILAGAGGSVPGCQSSVMTLTCRKLDAATPWTGIAVAGILGVLLFHGTKVLELLPMSVIGGVLFFIGADLLHTWLIRVRTQLPATECAIIVLIAAAIAVFGFVVGVGAGMLATLAVFAFRMSRVDVVAEEFTGNDRASTRFRPVPDRVILRERGDSLRTYRLRGYIFFGSAHQLAERLRRRMREGDPPVAILLDFADVPGCDLSAIDLLCRFVRFATAAGSRVLVCEASERLRTQLRRHLAAAGGEDILRFETDLDHGLESAEDAILKTAWSDHAGVGGAGQGDLLHHVADDLERHLNTQIAFEELVEGVGPRLHSRSYGAGEALARRGEVQEGALLLVAGEAAVHDPDGRRLYQCGPGHVIEPWATLSRCAAVSTAIARTACRTMVLGPADMDLLQRDDQELALRLHAHLLQSCSMAARQAAARGHDAPTDLLDARAG